MKNILSLFALGLMTVNVSYAIESAVFEQPEGEVRTYHGFSHSSYLEQEWGFKVEEDHDGLARRVIFADNGDVWFKNPLSWVPNDSWIRGTIDENNIITIKTPIQYASSASEQETSKFTLSRFIKGIITDDEGNQSAGWVLDTEKTDIQFQYTSDDRIIQINEGAPVMLGLELDGEFMLYGDYGIEYTRVSGSVEKFPTDVESEKWTLKCFMKGDYAYQVDVATKDDKFYIKGMWTDFPDATVVGDLEGDKVIIRSGQYMGFMTNGTGLDYYIYAMTGYREPYMLTFQYVSDGKDLEFTYDKENGVLTPLFDKDAILMVKKGQTIGSIMNEAYVYVAEISMKRFNGVTSLRNVEITDCRQELGYGWASVTFDMKPFDVDGNALNLNNLYYSFIIDEERMVFDEDDALYDEQYETLDGPKIEIPYLFDNDYGFDSSGSSTSRYVMFFHIPEESVGVQAIYYDEVTGNKLYSDITRIDLNTFEKRVEKWEEGKYPYPDINSVETLHTDGNVVSVDYYDLSGNKVNGAAYRGIVIEKVLLDNGTSRVSKKVIR